MKITVPTIACSGCIDTLTKAIHKLDGNAQVTGDMDSKTLSIQTEATEADIKAAIVEVGHEYS